MNDEIPKCYVCNKKAKQRKIFLPIRHPIRLGIEDACVCDTCFHRLPSHILKLLTSNANLQNGEEFNVSVLEALKRVPYTSRNLSVGIWLFYKHNGKSFFKHFTSRTRLINYLKLQMNTQTDYDRIEAFENGMVFAYVRLQQNKEKH